MDNLESMMTCPILNEWQDRVTSFLKHQIIIILYKYLKNKIMVNQEHYLRILNKIKYKNFNLLKMAMGINLSRLD